MTTGDAVSDVLEVGDATISAYPNPAQGLTAITFASSIAGPAKVAVMNNNGVQMQVLFDDDLAANEVKSVTYDTYELLRGVYIVRMVTAADVKNLKLMVKR